MNNIRRAELHMHAHILAPEPPLRVLNFLSPLLQETYDTIANALGASVRRQVQTGVGLTPLAFAYGEADIGFLCGLQYVRIMRDVPGSLELLGAPILEGARYRQQPIYYSDVVVRADQPYKSWGDLKDAIWTYNEESSHSGYNLVCASLLARGVALPYFARALRSGSHLASLHFVLSGQADATAIDSQVLDVLLRREPQLATQLRIIDTFGPSSIPPVVVAARLDPLLKQALRKALLALHTDTLVAQSLHEGAITRFVAIEDTGYNDLRSMLTRVEQYPGLFL
jgi:ABC-type phosphate/phosphonate transport system, periplasmic component